MQRPQRPQLLPDGTLGICRDCGQAVVVNIPTRLLIPHMLDGIKCDGGRTQPSRLIPGRDRGNPFPEPQDRDSAGSVKTVSGGLCSSR